MSDRATASVGLLNEDLDLVSETESCELFWTLSAGTWEVEFITHHRLEVSDGGARYIGIFRGPLNDLKVWFVLPISPSPDTASFVMVGPDF